MNTDFTVPAGYEVWKVAFEFDDKPGVFKNRPVIVISPKEINDRILVLSVKVTSHAPRRSCEGEITLQDWQFSGLPKPSVARCSKAAWLPLKSFQNGFKYGDLSHRDAVAVYQALKTLGIFTDL